MTRRTVGFAAAVILTGSLSGAASEPLKLTVSPQVMQAPGTFCVKAIIEPHRDNRALRIEAESGDFYRSTEVQLDGEEAPRVETVWMRNIPEGEYQLTVRLNGASGVRATLHNYVAVIGLGGQ